MKARTIVVGFDGSSDARKALDAAVDHVADDGVIHVVTAYDERSRAEVTKIMDALPEEFRNNYDFDAAPRGHLRDAELALAARKVAYEGHFVSERPAAAILDLAEELHADLIVIGSRGLGAINRFMRGSVSARVANHATTSLMIVRDDDADDDEMA